MAADGARRAPAPLVVEIKGHSLDDGPGIRSVVFLKGCPLRCSWCHNPEAIAPQAELSYDAGACLGQHDCVAACPRQALDPARPGRVDRERCTGCFKCTDVCATGALSIAGRALAPAAVVQALARYRPYYCSSGGGVTLSGGEPTLFMDYAHELLVALGALGVNRLLETCGHFSYARFRQLLAPHLEQVYFDLKLFDEAEHKRHCGRTNRLILDNFARLHADAQAGGVPVLARIPLIPGITATQANLRALAGFLRELGVSRVALLPYNPTWRQKADRLGRAPAFEQNGFMSEAALEECRAIFAGFEAG